MNRGFVPLTISLPNWKSLPAKMVGYRMGVMYYFAIQNMAESLTVLIFTVLKNSIGSYFPTREGKDVR
jgi:hypothetical protein